MQTATSRSAACKHPPTPRRQQIPQAPRANTSHPHMFFSSNGIGNIFPRVLLPGGARAGLAHQTLSKS
eukprot:15466379-Alexandrium_andersonii.AAC.1